MRGVRPSLSFAKNTSRAWFSMIGLPPRAAMNFSTAASR
jgi:hypothetical protein